MSHGSDKSPVLVGVIAGASGIRGDVRIASYTENPMDIGAYGPLEEQGGIRFFFLRVKRMAKGHVIAEVDGVADRNAAEKLRGTRLYVPRAALPPVSEGEFYHEDLIGLKADTVAGEDLGLVLAVHDYGAGAVLEVGHKHARTNLVPFTREVVPIVDLERGRLEIDPPAGLLDGKNLIGRGLGHASNG
ncbi:MAG: ribosome maturation factor RimM [Rhodospirillaceae bacterium]